MKKRFRIIVVFWLAVFIGQTAAAATVLLENEEVIQGTITQYSNEGITIETESGTRDIPLVDIHLIDYLGSAKDYQRDITQLHPFIVYLKNGEIIEGTITQFSNDFITLESMTGHGVLQLPTSSVNYITAGQARLRMDQRNGIGYVQKKSTLNASTGPTTYASDQLSYKMFFDEKLFGNVLIAYGNASSNGQKLQVFSLDYRMGMVFKTMRQMLLYYGGSVGYLQVNDDATGVDGTGTALSAFLGAELFFSALPNFGFSGEIGYRFQKAGEYEASDLSLVTFPSFSIHYYY